MREEILREVTKAKEQEKEVARKAEQERLDKERDFQRRAEANFKVDVNNLHFAADGGTERIKVDCLTNWTFSAVPDNWAIVNNEGNHIKIKVLSNTGADDRSDYFKIKCGSKEIRIDISQDTGHHYLGRVRECHPTVYWTRFNTLHDKFSGKEREDWRLAAFDKNENGILIYGSNGCSSVEISESKVYAAYKKIHDAGKNIKSIDYISNGHEYCIVCGDNEYSCYGPSSLHNKLKEYQNAQESILCVSMSEDNNYVIITDNHFYASKSSDMNILKKAKEQFGSIKYVCKTNLGICAVCNKGVYYDNIPLKMAEALENIDFTSHCVYFTDEGHYFIANEDGTSIKTNL